MIVLFVLGIVLLAYAAIQGVVHHQVRWVPITLGLLLTIFMGLGLQRAQQRHFLMAEVPFTKTQKIQPAVVIDGFNLVTTEKGSNGRLRYTYKTNDKTYQTLTQQAQTKVVAGKDATLKTTVMTYRANSTWRRFLLLGQKTLEQGGTTYKLTLPEGWYVVPNDKVDDLQKLIDTNESKISDKVRDEIDKRVAEKVKTDKDFVNDTESQNKLKNDVVKQVTSDAKKQLKVDIVNQISKWQQAE